MLGNYKRKCAGSATLGIVHACGSSKVNIDARKRETPNDNVVVNQSDLKRVYENDVLP